ncbi:MarR family winged helix-turn-helix transcriptional regulator [Streptomyces sp. SYSU K217416]
MNGPPQNDSPAGFAGRRAAAEQEEVSLVLEDQFCFTLYSASRAVTGAYRSLLEDLGLTYPQYLVMLVVWRRGPLLVKDLVEALALDYGTITPLLKRLEANGLLVRQRQARDERVVEVAATPKGRELRARALAVPSALGQVMGLSDDDIATASGILVRMTAHLNGEPSR